MTSLVKAAARNNAHLYQRVCAAHGCETVLRASYLLCLGKPPRFYGQAVTLLPGVGDVTAKEVSGGFKDSFCDIEPDPFRYELLFKASWITFQPSAECALALDWKTVQCSNELDEWESGWARGDEEAPIYPRQFPYSLLKLEDLTFHSVWNQGQLVGGAIFNRSDSVVGCSNLWALDGWHKRVWQDLPVYAGSLFPGVQIVGYERGHDLDLALGAGFVVTGPLRVWVPSKRRLS